MDESGSAARKRGPYSKSAARRRQIVLEAYRQFSVHGYRTSSLRDIAAAAGVSLSSIQHHFADKEGLLLAVLDYRDELGADPVGGVERFDERVVARARENLKTPGIIALFTVLSAEAVAEDHPAHDYFAERQERLRGEFTGEFEQLSAAGRLRDGVHPADAARLLLSLWEGVQLQWLYAPDRVDPASDLTAFFETVLHADLSV
ncbi:TetR/AcrR family transcriptional regulator [Leifsonia sp. 22587]|uniref:TetR/AcrR family transcriptional regulator n=1 Tax=Leifsonia sp. 22587 TaxID=3453946 RepID=UPI003F846A45